MDAVTNSREEIARTDFALTEKWIYHIGYLLLAISALIFLIFDAYQLKADVQVFFGHYVIGIIYAALLIPKKAFGVRNSWSRVNIHTTIILLNLFLVAAFALNRELSVFEKSETWLTVYIIGASVTLLSFRFFDRLPVWFNRLQTFLLGSTMIFYLYFTIYVLPFLPLSFIAIIVLGLGMFSFVPLTFLVATFFLLRYYCHEFTKLLWPFAGAILSLLILLSFVLEWSRRINKINQTSNSIVLESKDELPAWVKVAGQLQNDWITLRILKGDMVYTTQGPFENLGWFRSNKWFESRKHDPFVFVASFFSSCNLPEESRIKILQTLTGSRHFSEERLWAGSNLSTDFVVTDIDVFPALQIAYTEKYLTIHNSGNNNRTNQEALYTFSLPEGSVVTSLSLWINGEEEKAILTSKGKAKEAYQTIVGKEARDPSVVHWQEGNKVTVRVFPCPVNEDRKFKIGITSVLPKQGDKVFYPEITFTGPGHDDANAITRVRFVGKTDWHDLPDIFQANDRGDLIAEHAYSPDFTFSFHSAEVPVNKFTYNGDAYSISPHQPEIQRAEINRIYLDLNKSWQKMEILQFRELLRSHAIYTFHGNKMIRLSDSNWDRETLASRQQLFTLFPFHKIKDVEHSVVVTKNNSISADITDLKGSKFMENLSAFFIDGKKVKVYNLGRARTAYINALVEFRSVQLVSGTFEQLDELLTTRTFPFFCENENKVLILDAGLQITKVRAVQASLPDNAPDHLARLFAYNNVMRKAGEFYFKDDLAQDNLISEAQSAYIVSPVTSLIVLESKEDYKRFGIIDSENNLQNASKAGEGAVPEPHEWALIILFLVLVMYMFRTQVKVKLGL